MNLVDANRLAYSLVARHLPGMGYRIEWNNARNAAGQCNYTQRKLIFSALIIKHMSPEQAENVMTHEIAHALTPGHQHDGVWAAKHRELGGDGERLWGDPDVQTAVAKWVLTCQGCGIKVFRNRLSKSIQEKGAHHAACGRERGQFKITQNR